MLATDLLAPEAPGNDACPVIFGGARHTRATLRAASRTLAQRFQQAGIRPGDRVAVLSAGRMEVVETFFATAYAGAINVILNSFLKGELLAHQLELTKPQLLITDGAGAAAARAVIGQLSHQPRVVSLDTPGQPFAWVRESPAACGEAGPDPVTRRPEDPVSIVFTSGTTGRSKGCVISNRYFVESGRRMAEHFPLGSEDLYYTPYPLFHVGGQAAGLSYGLAAGCALAFDAEFHASTFWDRVRELGATYVQGTAAVGASLLARPATAADGDNPLRRASFIPMAHEAQRAFAERFGVQVVSEWYGQTEMSPICMNTAWRSGGCLGSMGRPLPDVDVRIVDGADEPVAPGTPGELTVRPRRPGIMFSGYWDQPDRTVEAWRELWYHTGDLAVELPDGSLSFVDRKTDSVRRSGENVSCFEVEQVLLRLPGVTKVAVHGVAGELVEDDIKAWIVPGEGAVLGPRDVFEHCAKRLPYFAIPRFVEFTEQLPVNALGKVVKDALREPGASKGHHDLKALGLVLNRAERRSV
jgi:carnitine-CoA ligase